MMSKSKYSWFFPVKRTIEQYPDGLLDGTVQSCIAKGAPIHAASLTAVKSTWPQIAPTMYDETTPMMIGNTVDE